MANIKFILNGCDISFIAEAPEDITLKQLLRQCDKIKPDWCACGICSVDKVYDSTVAISHTLNGKLITGTGFIYKKK